jgi:predicted DNA-binding protein (UPF0251 family)
MVKRGRPKCMRNVKGMPEADYFKPRGIPLTNLDVSELRVEELEAIRLVDYEGIEQEQAAQKMKVSRRTLARELKSGRKKIADALVNGKAIQIKGGYFVAKGERIFECRDEKHEWKQPAGTGRPAKCPECGSTNIRKKTRKT